MKNTKAFVAKEEEKKPINTRIISDYEMNEKVADRIVEIIETGNVQNWRRAWILKPDAMHPQTLKEAYNLVMKGEVAINIFNLRVFTIANGNFDIPAGFYVTFSQIKSKSLKLKKGSHGVATYRHAFFEKHLTREEKEAIENIRSINPTLDEILKRIKDERLSQLVEFEYMNKAGEKKHFSEILQKSRYTQEIVYTRCQYILEYQFNIDDLEEPIDVRKMWDIENIEDDQKEEPEAKKRDCRAERIREDYCKRAKLDFNETYQNEAFYSPQKHSVTVPTFGQFDEGAEYYATVFHELAHSTGANSLLNRKGICTMHRWGDKTYAKEELIAELSSIFTTKALYIDSDDTFKNSIAYLKSWGNSLLEGIRHNIIHTVNQSQKATDLILNITR